MARGNLAPPWRRLGYLLGAVILVASLYLAKPLLIPLALAMLLSFLLAPLVGGLERVRLPRAIAVVLTVAIASAALLGLGYTVIDQVVDLTGKLPRYTENIRKKLQSIRGGEAIEKAREGLEKLQELTREGVKPPVPPAPKDRRAGDRAAKGVPLPVQVVKEKATGLELARSVLGPLLGPLGMAGVVFVLVIFFLGYQEDMRDRLIRLVSGGRILVTTQALQEATQRISRYLVMTLIVNATYGIPVGIGLYFLDVPNPLLWGLLATVLRFIPYVGPVIGAGLPILLSFAVFDDWTRFGMVVGLFVVMELISNNAVEPLLYGRRTGLSPVAVIVASVFWTWVWGAVGLFLAIPLTVCLAVAGRYVEPLGFLHVLLGEEPGLSPADRLYQRLVAHDADEAAEVADEYLRDHGVIELYECVLLPVLQRAKRDQREGELDDDGAKFVFDSARELVDHVREHFPEEGGEAAAPARYPGIRLAYLPARGELDQIAGEILAQLLARVGIAVQVLSAEALTSELLDDRSLREAHIVCIGTLPPLGAMRVRYLCKRVRERFPDRKIAVAVWSPTPDPARSAESLRNAPLDRLGVGLGPVLDAIRELASEVVAVSPALAP